jgi:hypothetical protein
MVKMAASAECEIEEEAVLDMRKMLWGDWFYAKKKNKQTGKTERSFTTERYKEKKVKKDKKSKSGEGKEKEGKAKV